MEKLEKISIFSGCKKAAYLELCISTNVWVMTLIVTRETNKEMNLPALGKQVPNKKSLFFSYFSKYYAVGIH